MSSTKSIVLISGANRGIGYEIAKKLAAEQSMYHVIIGSRSLLKGEAAARSIADGSSFAVQLDVTSDQSIATCAEYIRAQFGKLDVLINNAGIGTLAVKDEPNLRKRLSTVFDTNTAGPAMLTEACIPLLRMSDNPRIVFISSEMGSMANTLNQNWQYFKLYDSVAYKVSKAALNMLAAVTAAKYGQLGFKVNACCPGLRKTDFTNNLASAGDPADGSIIAVRLAMLGKDDENGTFTNSDGLIPW